MATIKEQMRLVHRYCHNHGFSGGFPTFNGHSSTFFNYRAVIRFEGAIYKDLTEHELPNLLRNPEDIRLWIKDMNLFARDRFKAGGDYIGALPTFEQALKGNTVVLGVYFFGENEVDFKRVHTSELANLGIYYREPYTDEYFKAANLYAYKNGYISGLPTFTEVGDFFGVLLFKPTFAHVAEVPEHFIFNFLFTFEGFNHDFLKRLIKAIERAVANIDKCDYLDDNVKKELASTFQQSVPFTPHISPYPEVCPNESYFGCTVDGTIRINEANFPSGDEGDTDLARTVIHEMAHKAGYGHDPKKTEFNDYKDCGCTGSTAGVPEDAAAYWTSVPLMAECCIDGHQTLRLSD
ncbi:MAG: hypothetical protein ACQEWW_26450 [Bacillota bacterium]